MNLAQRQAVVLVDDGFYGEVPHHALSEPDGIVWGDARTGVLNRVVRHDLPAGGAPSSWFVPEG